MLLEKKKRKRKSKTTLIRDAGNVPYNIAMFNHIMGSSNSGFEGDCSEGPMGENKQVLIFKDKNNRLVEEREIINYDASRVCRRNKIRTNR